jgi:hypothetical protein
VRPIRGLLTALTAILALTSTPRAAQTATPYAFGTHSFSIALPPGYSLVDTSAAAAGMWRFTWVTEQYDDATSSVMQVLLIDLKKAGAPDDYSLDKFISTTTAAAVRIRPDWKAASRPIEFLGVGGKRIEWSGSMDAISGKGKVKSRGVMIFGIKNDIAFSLGAEDIEPRVERTLPVSEKALLSFELTTAR